jgi:ApbE superfamily uncharacterized protein (UPF0280 family)
VPIEARTDAPQIIKGMCRATKKVNVGPMAAVAGAISELVGLKLLDFSDEIVIENGGDIFLKTNVVRKVGIYAGKDSVFNNLGINKNQKIHQWAFVLHQVYWVTLLVMARQMRLLC